MPKTITNLAFGQALREYRVAASLSQERLSELADLDRTFISLLERGFRSPSLDTLLALARGLNITVATLVARAMAILETMDTP